MTIVIKMILLSKHLPIWKILQFHDAIFWFGVCCIIYFHWIWMDSTHRLCRESSSTKKKRIVCFRNGDCLAQTNLAEKDDFVSYSTVNLALFSFCLRNWCDGACYTAGITSPSTQIHTHENHRKRCVDDLNTNFG